MDRLLQQLRGVISNLDPSRESPQQELAQNLLIILAECVEIMREPTQELLDYLRTGTWMEPLESVLQSKYLQIHSGLRHTVVQFYVSVFRTGEVMYLHSVIRFLLSLLPNKSLHVSQRVCVAEIVGRLFGEYANRMISTVSEGIPALLKLLRSTDPRLREVGIRAIECAVTGTEFGINNLHPEIVKALAKLTSDRSGDVKNAVAKCLTSVALHSNNFATVSFETVMTALAKGLEDEASHAVQHAFGEAIGTLYSLTLGFHRKQGAQTADAANDDVTSAGGAGIAGMKLKDVTDVRSRKSFVMDTNTFQSASRYITGKLLNCPLVQQPGWVMALLTLLRLHRQELSEVELEGFVRDLLGLFKELPAALQNVEIIFRARVGYILHAGVTASSNEQQQLWFARSLLTMLADERSEHEIVLLLTELSHLMFALEQAVVAILEPLKSASLSLLRHSSYIVRVEASILCCAIAAVLPETTPDILQEALKASYSQAESLLTISGEQSPRDAAKKKQRDVEKLQRMYCFHGYATLVAMVLQNPTVRDQLSAALLGKAVDLGYFLAEQLMLATQDANKGVVCTLVRAGWSIIAAFMTAGYQKIRHAMPRLLIMWKESTQLICSEKLVGYELPQECACFEGIIGSIHSLLKFSSEAIYIHPNALRTIAEVLEMSFMASKQRFQPKLMNTLRFRVLQGSLIESFAWLPPGSFPATCQTVFVDSLRTMCDTTAAGVESCALTSLVREADIALDATGELRPSYTPFWDGIDMLDYELMNLELFAQPLHKKELEAGVFVTSLHTQFDRLAQPTPLHGSEWKQPLPTSISVDIRVLDASVSLLSATFGHQHSDLQLKCIKVVDSLVPTAMKRPTSLTMAMLSSEDERRRRERKNLTAAKNATATLLAIVQSLPDHARDHLDDMPWVSELCNVLLILAASADSTVRRGACEALGLLVKKIGQSALVGVLAALRETLQGYRDRKVDSGHATFTCAGALFTAACIWREVGADGSTKQQMVALLMEWCRVLDAPITLRTWALYSVAVMVKHMDVGRDAAAVNETLQTLRVIVSLVELHVLMEWAAIPETSTAAITSLPPPPKYEEPSFLAAMVCLINAIIPVLMDIDPTSSLIGRLLRVWEVIRVSSDHPVVVQSCLESLGLLSVFSPKSLPFGSAADLANKIMAGPLRTSVNTCRTLVRTIRSLSICAIDQVVRNEFDVLLFRLLEQALAGVVCSMAGVWRGMVIIRNHRRPGTHMHALIHEICSCIEDIVSLDAAAEPDVLAVRWALYLRAISMGMTTGRQLPQGGAPQGHDESAGDFADAGEDGEEEAAGFEQMHAFPGGNGGATAEGYTVRSIVSRYKEDATSRATGIGAMVRSRVRCLAIDCASTTVMLLQAPAHSSLELANKLLEDALKQRVAFDKLPAFACLHIHDLVACACACASSTVEDHTLPLTQQAGLSLLQALVRLFSYTVEPHAEAASGLDNGEKGAGTRVLPQFVPQIVAAVRPALALQNAPQLAWLAGAIVVDMLCLGFLHDPVVIKRLLRHMLPEQEMSWSSLRPDAAATTTTNSEVAVGGRIVRSTFVARLAALALDQPSSAYPFASPHAELKKAVDGVVRPATAQIRPFWLAVVADAVRLLSSQHSWPDLPELPASEHGGAVYEPGTSLAQIRPFLRLAMPSALLALCQTAEPSEFPLLFAICRCMLLSAGATQSEDLVQIEGAIAGVQIRRAMYPEWHLALWCLLCLRCAMNKSDLDDVEARRSVEWSLSTWKEVVASLGLFLVRRDSQSTDFVQRFVAAGMCAALCDAMFDAAAAAAAAEDGAATPEEMAQFLSAALQLVIRGIASDAPTVLEGVKALLPADSRLDDLDHQNMTGDQATKDPGYPERLLQYVGVLLRISQAEQCTPAARVICLRLVSAFALGAELAGDETTAALHTRIVAGVQQLRADALEEFAEALLSHMVAVAGPGAPRKLKSFQTLLALWQSVIASSKHELRSLYSIEQFILSDNAAISNVTLLAFGQLLRLLLEKNPQAAASMIRANLPAVLVVVQAEPGVDHSQHAAQVEGLKILFTFFASADAQQQEQLISLFFDALLCLVTPARASTPAGKAWGQGLTHLARLAPAAFKNAVIGLAADLRANLQAVMQNALSAQQATQSSAGVDHINPPKLDAAKFKRSTA